MPLSTADRIDALLKEATSNPYHRLPRLVVMVANSKEVLYSGAAGYTSILPPYAPEWEQHLVTAEKVTDRSIFDMWSATKLVASVAMMQLVEQGKIGLKEDARKWVKELQEIQILKGWTKDDEPILVKNEKPITPEMLLNHTAGFAYSWDENPSIMKYVEKYNVPKSYARNFTRADMAKLPLKNEPGERFCYGYSNDWLTVVVEEISGMSIEDYYQKYIFKPLSITDMSYIHDLRKMSAAFPGVSPTDPYTFRKGHDFKMQQHFGGAGLHGSPRSYLRITQALINGGALPNEPSSRILKKETVDLMFTPSLASDRQRRDFTVNHKGGSDPWSRWMPENWPGLDWGLGGFLNGVDFPSGRKKGSMSWSGAMSTFWIMDRESDLTFVVWTNQWPHSSDVLLETWAKIEPEIYKGVSNGKL